MKTNAEKAAEKTEPLSTITDLILHMNRTGHRVEIIIDSSTTG